MANRISSGNAPRLGIACDRDTQIGRWLRKAWHRHRPRSLHLSTSPRSRRPIVAAHSLFAYLVDAAIPTPPAHCPGRRSRRWCTPRRRGVRITASITAAWSSLRPSWACHDHPTSSSQPLLTPRAAERTRFGRPRQIDKMRSDPKSILKMGPVEVVGSRRRLICRDGLQYDPDGCNHHRAMLLSSMLPPWPRSNAPRTRDMLVCYCSLSVSSLRSMPPRPSYSRTVYKPSLGLGRRPLVRPPTRQVFA